MANLRDFTGKNKIFTGTDAETISSGTTAQRVNGAAKLRFNTTTNLMEYYDGTDWKAIDAPPVISGFTVDDIGGSSVTSATIDNEKSADSGLLTLEVLGSLFDTTGAGVQFIATAGNGETINTQSITRNSANKLTVTVTASDFDVANSPYTIRVTNGSGLSANLEACITADTDAPIFTNAADTNFDVNDSNRSSGTIAAADLIGASGVKASAGYAVTTGSLPTGFTLNTTSGDITWSSVSAVGSDTQTLFTITATSTEGGTSARQFGITVKAPQITTFNSPGTFTVPASLTSVDVLVIAGGGGGGAEPGNNGPGGGGAGGLIFRPGLPITASTPISVTVGGGGQGGTSSGGDAGNPGQGITGGAPNAQGANGSDSTFSGLTAKGGGGGACPDGFGDGDGNGQPGGSGGGAVAMGISPNSGGSATQPGQSGDSGTYGFGNAGGSETTGIAGQVGAGGGGAGGTGGAASGSAFPADAPNLPTVIAQGYGASGAGRTYSISGSPVVYAGGGAGHIANSAGINPGTYITAGPGGGGNGGWQIADNTGQQTTRPGTANRGGGGGGGRPGHGGDGGSGVVIVSF